MDLKSEIRKNKSVFSLSKIWDSFSVEGEIKTQEVALIWLHFSEFYRERMPQEPSDIRKNRSALALPKIWFFFSKRNDIKTVGVSSFFQNFSGSVPLDYTLKSENFKIVFSLSKICVLFQQKLTSKTQEIMSFGFIFSKISLGACSRTPVKSKKRIESVVSPSKWVFFFSKIDLKNTWDSAIWHQFSRENMPWTPIKSEKERKLYFHYRPKCVFFFSKKNYLRK